MFSCSAAIRRYVPSGLSRELHLVARCISLPNGNAETQPIVQLYNVCTIEDTSRLRNVYSHTLRARFEAQSTSGSQPGQSLYLLYEQLIFFPILDGVEQGVPVARTPGRHVLEDLGVVGQHFQHFPNGDLPDGRRGLHDRHGTEQAEGV